LASLGGVGLGAAVLGMLSTGMVLPRFILLLADLDDGMVVVGGVAASGVVAVGDGVVEVGDGGVPGGWTLGCPGMVVPGWVAWARTGAAPISAATPVINRSLCISKVLAVSESDATTVVSSGVPMETTQGLNRFPINLMNG
jgi:hypothetical protein